MRRRVPSLPWIEVLVFVLVALVALKTTHGLLGTFDLYLDDETVYLDGARYLGVHVLPIAESSPLYPLWYCLLSVLEPDRVRLYFTNWYVLTAALPVVLYTLARRSGATLAVAAAIAITWSVSAADMTWPFVTKFTTLLLALGALAATFAKDLRTAAAIGSITVSLAAYARAELTLFSFAFAAAVAGWTVVSLVRARRDGPPKAAVVVAGAATIAVPLLLWLHFGDTGKGNRAYFAFAQHYALNVVEAEHLPINPWTNWHTITPKAFPKATTVGAAWRENPTAFTWHVTRNLGTLPNTVTELFRPLRWVPVPLRNIVTIAFDVALASGLVGFLFVGSRGVLRRWLPLLALVAAAALGSILIVYPREHYVLPICFLGAAAVGAGSGRIAERLVRTPSLERPLRFARLGLVAGLAVFLAAVPTFRANAAPALMKASIPAPGSGARETVLTIDALRRLHLRGRVVMVAQGYAHALYTDYDYAWVPPWEKAGPFWQFVHRRGINVVFLNGPLLGDTRFVDDPEFTVFAKGEGQLEDFVRIPVEGTSSALMIRRALLPE